VGSNAVGDVIHVVSSYYGGSEHAIKRNYDDERSRSRREKRLLAQVADDDVPRLVEIALTIDPNGVGCNLPPNIAGTFPFSIYTFVI
jgi:hypothetical protein